MEEELKRSKAAIYIRDQLKAYFNQNTISEKRLRIRQSTIDFEKRKTEAMMSAPFLAKRFGPDELAIDIDGIKEAAYEESSSMNTDLNSSSSAKTKSKKSRSYLETSPTFQRRNKSRRSSSSSFNVNEDKSSTSSCQSPIKVLKP